MTKTPAVIGHGPGAGRRRRREFNRKILRGGGGGGLREEEEERLYEKWRIIPLPLKGLLIQASQRVPSPKWAA